MEATNKYDQHLSLHAKCLAILEARNEFVHRLNSAEDLLARFDAAVGYAPVRLMNNRGDILHNVALYQHTVKRMTGYYEGYARKVCNLLNPWQGKGLLDCMVYGKGNIMEYNPLYAMKTLQDLCANTSAPRTFGYIDHVYQDYGKEELTALT